MRRSWASSVVAGALAPFVGGLVVALGLVPVEFVLVLVLGLGAPVATGVGLLGEAAGRVRLTGVSSLGSKSAISGESVVYMWTDSCWHVGSYPC